MGPVLQLAPGGSRSAAAAAGAALSGHRALAAVVEFCKTRPTKEEVRNYLGQLAGEYPEVRSRLLFLGVILEIVLADPKQLVRMVQAIDLLNEKIMAAGFGDHPIDYIWRPVLAGALTFRDLEDGTASLVDVVEANDALDRHQARQQPHREKPKSTGEAEALKIAKVFLETGTAPTGPRGKVSVTGLSEKIAPMVDMTAGSVENAIRDVVRDHNRKTAKR